MTLILTRPNGETVIYGLCNQLGFVIQALKECDLQGIEEVTIGPLNGCISRVENGKPLPIPFDDVFDLSHVQFQSIRSIKYDKNILLTATSNHSLQFSFDSHIIQKISFSTLVLNQAEKLLCKFDTNIACIAHSKLETDFFVAFTKDSTHKEKLEKRLVRDYTEAIQNFSCNDTCILLCHERHPMWPFYFKSLEKMSPHREVSAAIEMAFAYLAMKRNPNLLYIRSAGSTFDLVLFHMIQHDNIITIDEDHSNIS